MIYSDIPLNIKNNYYITEYNNNNIIKMKDLKKDNTNVTYIGQVGDIVIIITDNKIDKYNKRQTFLILFNIM